MIKRFGFKIGDVILVEISKILSQLLSKKNAGKDNYKVVLSVYITANGVNPLLTSKMESFHFKSQSVCQIGGKAFERKLVDQLID